MGNKQIMQMQEDQIRKLQKDKKLTKKQLETIQQRLQFRQDQKITKSSSQQRTQITSQMTFDDSSKLKSVQKSRNVTPSTGMQSPSNINNFDITSLSKTFELPEVNMENKKNNHSKNSSIISQEQSNSSTTKKQDISNQSLSDARFKNRLKTTAGPGAFYSKSRQHNAPTITVDNFGFEDDMQNHFDQLLEGRDGDPNSRQQKFLEMYYRKGSTPNYQNSFQRRKSRKLSDDEKPKQDLTQSLDVKSQEQQSIHHTPTRNRNKFAKRMEKYMQPSTSPSNHTSSGQDESSSSRSSKLNSARNKSNLLINDGSSFDVDGLDLSHIPAMSHDGMGECNNFENNYNHTTETEEEYAVIDRGDDYKLSIMRKKRALPQQNENDGELPQGSPDFVQFPRFRQEFPTITEDQKEDEEDQGEIKPRGGGDTMMVRYKYMQKLSQARMMDPSGQNRPKSHQTIIIWDWDDTLMSSTFLSPYQPHILSTSVRKKLPKIVRDQLDHLQELIIKLMQKSVKQGATYIITNAGHGWVELNGFKEWKFRTFSALAEKMDKDIITNIVAVGDSQIEIDAAVKSYVKTVKLKEQPNLVELTKQVELILSQFEEICSCAKNLTIRLQKVQDEDQSKQQ
ncbi:UNKNOWN [Stylonychia lemnae]|uniref:Uncharacterized protein n=1 Tax=Stylonychia lemnae TaxID=5949 RepID=A0A078AFT5_STYLE|nr:UNKNOWN [Stylonychia lemnae]|eukprot:CDW81094.1 UNKNOWN [Stylonychia lemnae]